MSDLIKFKTGFFALHMSRLSHKRNYFNLKLLFEAKLRLPYMCENKLCHLSATNVTVLRKHLHLALLPVFCHIVVVTFHWILQSFICD